jgi:hypothetical protein
MILVRTALQRACYLTWEISCAYQSGVLLSSFGKMYFQPGLNQRIGR